MKESSIPNSRFSVYLCVYLFFIPFPHQSGSFLDLYIDRTHSHFVGHYFRRQGPYTHDICWVITSHAVLKTYCMSSLKFLSFSRYLMLIFTDYSYFLRFLFSYLNWKMREFHIWLLYFYIYNISTISFSLPIPVVPPTASQIHVYILYSTIYNIYNLIYIHIYIIVRMFIWLEVTVWD